MEQDRNFTNKNNSVFSKRIKAGKRRTYFFDVRTTRSNDYYLTITESKRRFNEDGYERHKLHLYKEDFNKFLDALQDTIEYVKDDLMPEYDFDEYTNQGNFEDKNNKPHTPSKEASKSVSFEAEEEGEVIDEADLKSSPTMIDPPKKDNHDDFNPPKQEIINEDDLKWD